LIGVLASLLLPVWSDTITYVHTDMMGSPIAETDESGNVLWREHYTPFGEKVDKEAASVNNSIGYTGHVNDSDTGLTYMQARYYDPVIGRFYSNDPVGFSRVDNFNRYAYAANNPYRYTDPDGRDIYDINAALRTKGQPPMGNFQLTDTQAKVAAVPMVAVAAAGAILAVGVKEVIQGVIEEVTGVDIPIPSIKKAASSFSRKPKTIQDKMTLNAAQEGQGNVIIKNLSDPKFLGMNKIKLKVKSNEGNTTVVHYVKDPKTGKQMDYKFKKHSNE